MFYINVPIGALAFARHLVFVTETKRDAGAKLDWFGFGMLSLAIAALQLFLDRGEQLDWFSSGEIIDRGGRRARSALLPLPRPHLHGRETRSSIRGCSSTATSRVGMFFIFIVGITYLASLALMTPYLQTLMGYPVVTAGIVMGPRGLGTMVCMFIVGRLIGTVDIRGSCSLGLGAHRLGDVRHDRLDARRLAMDDRQHRLHPGRRPRLPVRAADHGDLRDAAAASSAAKAPASTTCRATSARASASRWSPPC